MQGKKEVKERGSVLQNHCWNVESLYRSWEQWDEDFAACSGKNPEERWAKYTNKALDLANPFILRTLLDSVMEMERRLDFLYTYAHLRHDEDSAEEKAKQAYMASLGLIYSFKEAVSWIDPALLQLSQEVLDASLKAEELQEYRPYLRKIIRLKPHTLKEEEERLLALAGRSLGTSQNAFQSLNNADLRFLPCKNEKGVVYELTHGTYHVYMKERDRVLREQAFSHLHQAFEEHENTICELLQGQVQNHVFIKRARKFSSCLEAALYPHEIDISVYDSLISTVRKRLPILHSYMELRKKTLGYAQLHFYDLSVPLVEEATMKMSYEEAVEAIIASVAPLGEEYQTILRRGLLEERWVDRYENKRKRSGAYSSGCYGSLPYILLNYHGTFQDVMTLTHEAGHSMHSYFSRKHQKYQDHQYPIFLAEVASTFHEELLFNYFLNKAANAKEKAYLINQKIDGIRNTLFRQVLFAEFEKLIHEWAEQEKPLTPAFLREEYLRLNKEYFGPSLEMCDKITYEWARIPHFYYNFYVYQYGTGLSAAHVLADRILKKDPRAKEEYFSFLSSGGVLDPISTLKQAGVDMTIPSATEALLSFFEKMLLELKALLEK